MDEIFLHFTGYGGDLQPSFAAPSNGRQSGYPEIFTRTGDREGEGSVLSF
ncbi:MAG: hypothetical protein KAR20_20990 [Candidatus Heimdallarchaeota archaeon]|nr:hypothetical protein [Candidatus Heimdallarchaeota archaeon]